MDKLEKIMQRGTISNNDEYEINCDIFVENKRIYAKQSGCYEISTLKLYEILNLVKSLSPLTNYRNFYNL